MSDGKESDTTRVIHNPLKGKQAFTLVELLVVIGIIAILVGILLPALNKARRAANVIVDQSNMRQVFAGMRLYGTQYNDGIPGAPANTANFLFAPDGTGRMDTNPAYGDTNCPSIVTCFDYMSPVLRAMGVAEQPNDDGYTLGGTPHFNAGGSVASRESRFEFVRHYPLFQCPENQFLAGPYASSPLPCTVDVDLSYYTAANFLELPYDGRAQINAENTLQACPSIQLPSGYKPSFGKIKNSSAKICLFCGEAYTTSATAPDINLKWTGWAGGSECFTDLGSFSQDCLALPRNYRGGPVISNTFNPLNDYRPICYRHGNTQRGGKIGSYMFIAVMYDGHAEVLDDLTGSNPSYWMPTGTILNHNSGDSSESTYHQAEIWTDTAAKFGYTNSGPNVIP